MPIETRESPIGTLPVPWSDAHPNSRKPDSGPSHALFVRVVRSSQNPSKIQVSWSPLSHATGSRASSPECRLS